VYSNVELLKYVELLGTKVCQKALSEKSFCNESISKTFNINESSQMNASTV